MKKKLNSIRIALNALAYQRDDQCYEPGENCTGYRCNFHRQPDSCILCKTSAEHYLNQLSNKKELRELTIRFLKLLYEKKKEVFSIEYELWITEEEFKSKTIYK